jgi:hypothetical protein
MYLRTPPATALNEEKGHYKFCHVFFHAHFDAPHRVLMPPWALPSVKIVLSAGARFKKPVKSRPAPSILKY